MFGRIIRHHADRFRQRVFFPVRVTRLGFRPRLARVIPGPHRRRAIIRTGANHVALWTNRIVPTGTRSVPRRRSVAPRPLRECQDDLPDAAQHRHDERREHRRNDVLPPRDALPLTQLDRVRDHRIDDAGEPIVAVKGKGRGAVHVLLLLLMAE